jgi:hypothetical protein
MAAACGAASPRAARKRPRQAAAALSRALPAARVPQALVMNQLPDELVAHVVVQSETEGDLRRLLKLFRSRIAAPLRDSAIQSWAVESESGCWSRAAARRFHLQGEARLGPHEASWEDWLESQCRKFESPPTTPRADPDMPPPAPKRQTVHAQSRFRSLGPPAPQVAETEVALANAVAEPSHSVYRSLVECC